MWIGNKTLKGKKNVFSLKGAISFPQTVKKKKKKARMITNHPEDAKGRKIQNMVKCEFLGSQTRGVRESKK